MVSQLNNIITIFTLSTLTVLNASIPLDDYIGEEDGAVEVCVSLSANSEIQFNNTNVIVLSTRSDSGNYYDFIVTREFFSPKVNNGLALPHLRLVCNNNYYLYCSNRKS